jgi:GNAT superfamily N-acetyltransferase
MEIQIRRMQIEDAPDVQRLSQQLGYPLDLSVIENNIRELTNDATDSLFIAAAEETIVGWIHGFKAVRIESTPFVEIGGLIVDENFRGKGVGKKLVERLKQWCCDRNIADIRVRSNVKRSEAHKFYIAAGFTEIKEQKIFQTIL